MTDTVLFILEIVGTAVFAASGALAGLQRQLDAFGVVILGVCTACGGGVIRDLTLGITPPVMFCQPVYALVAMGVSALVFLPAVRHLLAVESRAYELVMLWLDSIGLRLFDALGVDPNYLYRDAYRAHGGIRSDEEQALLEGYRRLSLAGRQTVHTMVRALEDLQQESERLQPRQDPRTIPLYASPAAAGYAAPVFNEDYETIPVTGQVPRGAELAVRIQGDSMEPYIHDGGVVYVNHDPLHNGDVGIFCVDGDMVCKQYYRDPLGMVYLFSLNRRRSDADVLLPPSSGRSLTCFGRVMLHGLPLPQ